MLSFTYTVSPETVFCLDHADRSSPADFLTSWLAVSITDTIWFSPDLSLYVALHSLPDIYAPPADSPRTSFTVTLSNAPLTFWTTFCGIILFTSLYPFPESCPIPPETLTYWTSAAPTDIAGCAVSLTALSDDSRTFSELSRTSRTDPPASDARPLNSVWCTTSLPFTDSLPESAVNCPADPPVK